MLTLAPWAGVRRGGAVSKDTGDATDVAAGARGPAGPSEPRSAMAATRL